MSRAIKQIRHRRPGQRQETPDLILAVGQPLPIPYQIDRPPGVLVKSIEKLGSYECTLTLGDPIWVSEELVLEVKEG